MWLQGKIALSTLAQYCKVPLDEIYQWIVELQCAWLAAGFDVSPFTCRQMAAEEVARKKQYEAILNEITRQRKLHERLERKTVQRKKKAPISYKKPDREYRLIAIRQMFLAGEFSVKAAAEKLGVGERTIRGDMVEYHKRALERSKTKNQAQKEKSL